MVTTRRRSGFHVAGALAVVAVVANALVAVPAANAAPPISGLIKVSASGSQSGGSHTCAVTSSATVECWGSNRYGQLGNNSTTTSAVPVTVPGLSSIAQVAAGGSHSCALTTAGAVDCWGSNLHDQVGQAPSVALHPYAVSFPQHHVVAISLGDSHSCALLDTTGVKCWGDNSVGQLGNGGVTSLAVPSDVQGLTSGVTAISAYGDHTCARTTAGGVECWGLNDHGQLGNNTTTNSRVPVPVTGLSSGVQAIALGEQRSCALTTAGGVECWGSALFGQLGNNSNIDAHTPVAVTGLSSGVDEIAAGGSSTCALSTGVLQCWGYNSRGQVGDGTTTNRGVPVIVALGASITGHLSIGLDHACVQIAAGVKCWGGNENGQLGDGTFVDLYGPFLPDPPTAAGAAALDHAATVSWTPPAYDGGVALTSYTVTSSPPSESIVVVPPQHVATLTGLINGTTYTFSVKATNGVGDSRQSVPSNPVVPAGLPGAPLKLGVSTGDGLATLSWGAAYNNGSALTAYRITASPGSRSAIVSGSSSRATIAGLSNGTKYSFTVRAANRLGFGPAASITKVLPIPKSGYWMLGSNGAVYPFGNSQSLGSASYPTWASGVSAVAMAVKRDGSGYWVVDNVGGVHPFGSARSYGQYPSLASGERVSTIAATPSGAGYWLFTNRGRAVPYGNARFFGDMHAVTLNGPVIASAATPTGNGYFMVASDGGVFTFGDARFHGSTGGLRLNKPVVGLSATPSNGGYWLVASDGGVFAFGDGSFRGSMGGTVLNQAVNGLVPFGNGYLMVASDGGVFDFSNKPFYGSLGGRALAAPIIGIAAFTF